MEKRSKMSVFTAGIIRDNPVLVLILGTCPSLAGYAAFFKSKARLVEHGLIIYFPFSDNEQYHIYR